jgi:hypothetical protein
MRLRATLVVTSALLLAAAATADPVAHFNDHGIDFDFPDSWQTYETQYHGLHWLPLVYVSSQTLSEPCISTPRSLSCSWPLDRLGDNGVVAGWYVVTLPRLMTRHVKKRRVMPRHTIMIDGARVRFDRAYPGSCAAIAGDESLSLTVPRRSVSFWACIRGPDFRLSEQRLFAMLRSTTFSP